MRFDETLTWSDLFEALQLAPGIPAELPSFYTYDRVLGELQGAPMRSTVSERLAFLGGLLAPFFCPHISFEDTFAIAQAGESSPAMFRVFQERSHIMPVLPLCKRLKVTPVLVLAHEGSKVMIRFVDQLLVQRDQLGIEDRRTIGANLISYFAVGAAREAAEATRAYLLAPDGTPLPDIDVFALVTALPGWSLIRRDDNPLQWASRHDEIAVALKNIELPGRERRQRQAVKMMEEAIETFDDQGAGEDAAIARSNLANLMARVQWLTVEERTRRASALYDAAVASAKDPEFRALLMDNIASRLAESAAAGLSGTRGKALEMCIQASEQLESCGRRDRLPEVLANLVTHLAGLRAETAARREDLRRAREVGQRAMALMERLPDNAATERLRPLLFRSLADVYVRSTDYESGEKWEFAREALRLMDLVAAQLDRREVDSAYLRAKAHRVLGELGEALEHIDRALIPLLEDDGNDSNAEFSVELLRARYELLSSLRPHGDAERIQAAERWSAYALAHDIVGEWAAGETSFLMENLYAIADALTVARASARPDIVRAEQVLTQLNPESIEARRLEATLAGAYAWNAAASLDAQRLLGAVMRFREFGEEIPPLERVVVLGNILSAWFRIVVTTHRTALDGVSIDSLAAAGAVLVAEYQAGNPALRDDVREAIEEVAALCRMSQVYNSFLQAESCSTDNGALRRVGESLRQRASEERARGNVPFVAVALREAAAYALAADDSFEDADAAYCEALDAASTLPSMHQDDSTQNARDNPLAIQIRESLYANLARYRPLESIREVAAQDSAAGAWMASAEERIVGAPVSTEAESEHLDRQDAEAAVRSRLMAFEQSLMYRGLRKGWLRSPDADVSSAMSRWRHETQKADEALRMAGLPAFDTTGFGIQPVSRLSDAATVLLVHGRTSGRAIIVPPSAPVHDAVTVELPGYSSRVAYELTFDPRAGWVPALLAWRNASGQAAFETALRRIAVRLWECALGPVDDALHIASRASQQGPSVNLILRGDQRLLPWHCASPSITMESIVADRWRLSTGFDLGTLLLGQARERRQTATTTVTSNMRALVELMLAAPLLGVFLETLHRMMNNPREGIAALSITDGTDDLPMTRFEGDAAVRAFSGPVVHLEGGIEPDLAPVVLQIMERARVIHLAGHGEWMPIMPWLSAVWLGPAFPLYAATVRARTRLDGPLVVLSACESGIGGPAGTGEGGLVQAFLLAGARAVVASSWMVQDLSSLVLADAFLGDLPRSGDMFASMAYARTVTRSMSLDILRGLVTAWEDSRPNSRDTLERSFKRASSTGSLPFQSPVYWAAPFIGMTGNHLRNMSAGDHFAT